MRHEEIKTGWLTINRACTNRCAWCYARNAVLSDMDLEEAKLVIDALADKNIKKIVLIGGEPTIYPYIKQIIQYINEKDMFVGLVSNGQKFADMQFCQSILEMGPISINISVKGVTSKEYADNTGNLQGFDQMIQGIRNLNQCDASVMLSYVVTDDSTYKIEQFLDLAESERVERILFQFEKPLVGFEENSEIMPFQQMGTMTQYICERCKTWTGDYGIEVSFPFCHIDRSCLEHLIANKHIVSGCHIPAGTGIIFDTDCRVLPCNHFVNFPYREDKVTTAEQIDELWDSKEVAGFRKRINCFPSEKCKDCMYWTQCGGGCMTRWLSLNPEDEIVGI